MEVFVCVCGGGYPVSKLGSRIRLVRCRRCSSVGSVLLPSQPPLSAVLHTHTPPPCCLIFDACVIFWVGLSCRPFPSSPICISRLQRGPFEAAGLRFSLACLSGLTLTWSCRRPGCVYHSGDFSCPTPQPPLASVDLTNDSCNWQSRQNYNRQPQLGDSYRPFYIYLTIIKNFPLSSSFFQFHCLHCTYSLQPSLDGGN